MQTVYLIIDNPTDRVVAVHATSEGVEVRLVGAYPNDPLMPDGSPLEAGSIDRALEESPLVVITYVEIEPEEGYTPPKRPRLRVERHNVDF